jgi:hypothetical protein
MHVAQQAPVQMEECSANVNLNLSLTQQYVQSHTQAVKAQLGTSQ